MAKPELGTKRICPETGRKFYDLNKEPVISPYTGKVVPVETLAARARPEPVAAVARAPAPAEEVAVPEPAEAEFVSLEEADAEAAGTAKKPGEAPGGRDRGRRGRDRRDPRRRRLHRGAGGRRRRRDRHHRRRYRERGGRLIRGQRTNADISVYQTPSLYSNLFDPLSSDHLSPDRGHSSVGRALEWHSRGRRFDSAWLHQFSLATRASARQTSRDRNCVASEGGRGSCSFACRIIAA